MFDRLTSACALLAAACVLMACQLLADIEDRELGAGGAPHGGSGGAGASGGSTASGGLGGDGGGGTGGSAGGPGCAVDLIGGAFHVCAQRSDDATYCWGANDNGQAGRPGPSEYFAPVEVVSAPIARFGTGNHSTFAISSTTGGVVAWGLNDLGQLGAGDRNDHLTPLQLGAPLDADVDMVDGGYGVTCFLSAGHVRCVGADSVGALGDGIENPAHPICLFDTPCSVAPVTPIGMGSGVTAIALGWDHACAEKNGAVWCWGHNADGQIDLTSWQMMIDEIDAPVEAFSNPNVTALAAGKCHTCAVLSDRTLWCWGCQDGGRDPWAQPSGPTQLSGVSDVEQVSANWEHSCVLEGDGSVWCWGGNSYGQVGQEPSALVAAPTQVPLGAKATRVAALEKTSCALLEDGNVVCWGRNLHGELGNNEITLPLSSTPVLAAIPCP